MGDHLKPPLQMGVPMNLLQNAIRKLGKKNILVVVLFFIVSCCL